jgi:hypothetical protein
MDSSSSIKVIAISKGDARLMLIGFTSGKIWKTLNSGASWQNVSTGLPSGTVTDILFDPLRPEVFYCCYSGYTTSSVFKTVNGGAKWFSIAGNLPAIPKTSLEINPRDTSNIFIGTDFGVYSTTNGGTTWQILGDGMPKAVVVDLELHPSGVLRAATHGRSIYELAVTVPVELVAFTAEQAGRDVLLRWRTQSETNNAGFVIQRRTGVTGWEDIGYTPGQGSSMATHDYEYHDGTPPNADELVYRLKQMDIDGSFEYSPEARLDYTSRSAADFALDQNYPNPCNPVTTIAYRIPSAGDARITVTDANGRTIGEYDASFRHPGSYVAHLDTAAFPTGTYFYHLVVDGVTRMTKSMVVLK